MKKKIMTAMLAFCACFALAVTASAAEPTSEDGAMPIAETGAEATLGGDAGTEATLGGDAGTEAGATTETGTETGAETSETSNESTDDPAANEDNYTGKDMPDTGVAGMGAVAVAAVAAGGVMVATAKKRSK